MEIVAAIAAKIADYTVVPIHQFGYLIHYNSNIASLGDQVHKLKDVQTGVQGLVDADERNGQVIRQDVQTWLMKVNTMTEWSDSFFRDEVNPNQRCSSFSSCPNLLLRYKVSRKAKKKKLAVGELLDEKKFDAVSFPPPPPPIFVGDGVEVYKSRESTLNEIKEALKDDKTNIIGLYGMGGIGKTTLVKNVAKEYKHLLFDESAMAVVSQTPTIKKIQDEIASSLGLDLHERESLQIRAGRIRERINKSKRILVILDDLWDGLDLEEIGLPQVDVHKGCKILLTTRIYQVCVQMQSQSNFPIEILSESEAWDLFRKIAGDVVDSVDLKPIATEVAHECAGLPLSIVTVARTLMKVKDRSVWRDAARRLKNPSATNITEMHTKVYSSLKLSYDFLDDKDAKYCFLLCCLADEDSDIRIESLVGFGIGLETFDSGCTLLEIRDTVKASMNKLKDRSLLLHGKYEDCVRMHDVVRDFATSVVSEVERGSWARMDIGSKNPSAFNNDKFDCSNLKMLLLKSPDDSLDNLFERMKDLRVLSIISLRSSKNGIPSSVQYLVNLRTLCIEDCYVRQDLSFIGKLKSLEVLSFFRCGIQELPREIEQLKRLRVLELRECHRLNVIPAGVISSLSQLEGLYMRENSFTDWGKNGNASLVELNDLTKLSTIEFHLPGDVKLFPNVSLSEYQISLGIGFISAELEWLYRVCSFSKVLKLGNCHQSIASHDGVKKLKMLVNNAESLISQGLEEEDLEYFLSELKIEGFSRLKYLKVSENKKIEYLVADNTISELRICLFPVLEELELEYMQNLRGICCGLLPSGSFCELRNLILKDLPNLENLWVGNASLPNLRDVRINSCGSMKNLSSLNKASDFCRQLSVLEVSWCQNLEEIFTYDDIENGEALATEHDEIVFSEFRILTLKYVPNLTTFCNKRSNHISDSIQKALFSEKIAFPNLEELTVSLKFQEIWPQKIPGSSFCRLRDLRIYDFHKIKSAIPSNMVHQLQNLEKIIVWRCDGVEEIVEEEVPRKLNKISVNDCGSLRRLFTASQACRDLKEIYIGSCRMMKEIVGSSKETGNCTLELPLLEELIIRVCPKLDLFFGGSGCAQGNESQKALLPPNNNVKRRMKKFSELFGGGSGCAQGKESQKASSSNNNDAANVRESFNREEEDDVVIQSLFNEKVLLPNLRVLVVEECDSLRNLFTPSVVKALACLERLSIENCSFLEQVVVKEEEERIQISDQDRVIVFPKLRTMELTDLPKLGSFYLGNLILKFPSLEEVSLSGYPHMQIFYSCPAVAPVNTQVSFVAPIDTYIPENPTPITDYSPEGDLNSVVRYLFNKKVLLPNLRKLEVTKCNSLRNLFTPSVIKALACLEELRIKNCSFLEQVVVKEEEEIIHVSDQDKVMVFPKLRIMELIDLPKLGSFYPGNLTLKFPSLGGVSLSDCPHMQTFSSSPVFAPVYTKVSFAARTLYGDVLVSPTLITEYSPEGDLNSVVRYLFNKKGTRVGPTITTPKLLLEALLLFSLFLLP